MASDGGGGLFRRIMVPVDGSALAERPLPAAMRITGATGAAVHLVRVVEPPDATPGTAPQDAAPVRIADWLRMVQAEAAAHLDVLRGRADLAGLPVDVRGAWPIGPARPQRPCSTTSATPASTW